MKGSVLKKFLCTCLVTAAAFAATTISASACTTIYVGGDLVEEGTPEAIFTHPQSPRLQDFLAKVL